MRKIIIVPFLICAAFFLPSLISPELQAKTNWKTLAPGLELGIYDVQSEVMTGDASITILRIDPSKYDLKLLSMSETGESHGMSVKDWCSKYHCVAGINAGMFAQDNFTHIGFMRSGNHVNSSKVTSYKSVAAFSPKEKGIPRFRIFDLDKTEMSTIKKKYGCVVQNLRLLKRPGINCWSEQDKKWSEAALAEDKSGRVLFIFSRHPYSMHYFNRILLKLPIDIVCAQHLEGGPEAQMYINAGKTELEKVGSYETGFNEDVGNEKGWSIPNVIGVVKRGK